MSAERRIDIGYVLQREARQLSCFSREYGLQFCTLPARAEQSPRLRAVQPFCQLEMTFTQRGVGVWLNDCEMLKPWLPQGQALVAGWYINELLSLLVPRLQPHPELFDAYELTLQALVQHADLADTLRGFELQLLLTLDALPELRHDEQAAEIVADAHYCLGESGGWARCAPAQAWASGETLLALRAGRAPPADALRDLCRWLIARLLDGRRLHSRDLWRSMYPKPSQESEGPCA